MVEPILSVFHQRVKRGIKRLISFKTYIHRCRSDESFKSVDWYKSIINETEEGINLIAQYNSLEIKNLVKVKLLHKHETLSSSPLEEVMLYLREILREIQDVDSYLNYFLMPNLSETEKGKIDILRKDLDNLETEEKIIKNLKIALMEAESGHELACGIISARVIVERLEKIDGPSDEERLAKLIAVGIIDNKESSKFSSKAFLDAARSSRNSISHKNDFFPTGAESLSILASAFRIVEWISKYQKSVEK